MNKETIKFTLFKKEGKYFLQMKDSKQMKPVKINWLLPFDQKNSGISITNYKKEELIYLDSIKNTTSANQKLIRQALKETTFLPEITEIKSIIITHGIRYWNTITSAGPKLFAMIKPSSYITFINQDKIVVRDTFNNYYQIKSIAKLDVKSQKELGKIL